MENIDAGIQHRQRSQERGFGIARFWRSCECRLGSNSRAHEVGPARPDPQSLFKIFDDDGTALDPLGERCLDKAIDVAI